ncbi:hypothetical protein [Bifidobacterium phasiani]|nr:hypothetical protein [Bifidobacterium phasiani]
MMDQQMFDKALRSPLAATDPSLGSYALSQTVWNGLKRVIAK